MRTGSILNEPWSAEQEDLIQKKPTKHKAQREPYHPDSPSPQRRRKTIMPQHPVNHNRHNRPTNARARPQNPKRESLPPIEPPVQIKDHGIVQQTPANTVQYALRENQLPNRDCERGRRKSDGRDDEADGGAESPGLGPAVQDVGHDGGAEVH